MKSHSRNQIVFLVLYPILHCGMSLVFLMMTINTGLGPGEVGDAPATSAQEIVSSIGHFMLLVLWAPIYLAATLGVRLPGSDWIWIALTGLLYGYLVLLLFRKLR